MPDSIVNTPPTMNIISGGTFGAGVDVSYTIPPNQIFHVHSIHLKFLIVGGLRNRVTLLRISDGTNHFMDIPINSNQPPGDTIHYTWSEGQQYNIDAATDAATAPLPLNLYLPAGYIIYTVTIDLAIGDQYSDFWLYISPFILPVDRG